jgi:hypothetical protein
MDIDLTMRRLAPEGSGDTRAAFPKNRSSHDNQKPQGGEKGEGAQRCNHRNNPSLERQTKPDTICSD